jgi:hypothetical protein
MTISPSPHIPRLHFFCPLAPQNRKNLEKIDKLEILEKLEKLALWLQTSEGIDWSVENEDDTDIIPSNGAIMLHIRNEYLLPLAGKWENQRIRDYLDHAARRD